jgi:hypothetical protein
MKKIASIVLSNRTYYCEQLPAWEQFLLLPRITSAIGPALAKLAGGNAKGLMDLDLSELGPALEKLFERLNPMEQEGIARALLKTVNFEGVDEEGKKVGGSLVAQFDTAMQGRMLDVFKLLKFVFEVNFGSFSAALAPFIKRAGASLSGESITSQTSGPAGG